MYTSNSNSMRRVLLALLSTQQRCVVQLKKNMVEMLVRQLCLVGLARFGDFHLSEQLLTTVGRSKHGSNLL